MSSYISLLEQDIIRKRWAEKELGFKAKELDLEAENDVEYEMEVI